MLSEERIKEIPSPPFDQMLLELTVLPSEFSSLIPTEWFSVKLLAVILQSEDEFK